MKSHIFNALIVLSISFLTGCADDGTDGLDGLIGKDGANGKDGKDGSGVEELVKDGYVTLIFSGTLPTNIPFKDTVTFAYAPPGDVEYSVVENKNDGNDRAFSTKRYEDPASAYYKEVLLDMTWSKTQNKMLDFTMSSAFYFINARNQYLEMRVYEASLPNTTVKDYAYNENTADLKYTFETTIPSDKNSTEHELKVSGVVNAKAYEFLSDH